MCVLKLSSSVRKSNENFFWDVMNASTTSQIRSVFANKMRKNFLAKASFIAAFVCCSGRKCLLNEQNVIVKQYMFLNILFCEITAWLKTMMYHTNIMFIDYIFVCFLHTLHYQLKVWCKIFFLKLHLFTKDFKNSKNSLLKVTVKHS